MGNVKPMKMPMEQNFQINLTQPTGKQQSTITFLSTLDALQKARDKKQKTQQIINV